MSEAVANHHVYQQPAEVLRNVFVTLIKQEEFWLLDFVPHSAL